MKCQANGRPENFTFSWMKNNLSSSDFSYHVTSKVFSSHGKYFFRTKQKLLINVSAELELERDQAGKYFCVVRNSEGESSPCEIHIDFQNIGKHLPPNNDLTIGWQN